MGFDRNTVIGFILLMGLLGSYLYFAQRGQSAAIKERQRQEDSIKKAQALLVDSAKIKIEVAKVDSAKKIELEGGFTGQLMV